MSAAELKELKQLIIHEVQFVEEEWKLKVFAKLLDLEEDVESELDKRMERRKSGDSKSYSWEEVEKELEVILKK